MTSRIFTNGWVRLALAFGSATAFAACMSTETAPEVVSRNNSDPSKANYSARISTPDLLSRAEAKKARIRAKIEALRAQVDNKLGKRATNYLVGYLKPATSNSINYSCPNGESVVFMDDEDDSNDSRLYKDSTGGWVAARSYGSSSEEFVNSNYFKNEIFRGIGQPNAGQETKFRFCEYSVSSLPQANFDYAVLSLDVGGCPTGSYSFYGYWDNEDAGNANFTSGTISSLGYQDSDGTYLPFCFVPKSSSAGGIWTAASNGGVLGWHGYSSSLGEANQGYVLTDDEDENNSNEWGFSSGTGSYTTRIQAFAYGLSNMTLVFTFLTPIPVGI